ncbi:hypothetical protein LCGC14_0919770 [marine sediment metagenome]|uniref:Uncharacterized protein n=1 Tax=marine sediment metagenome TaxID=412755 RepID=A0A0F9PBR9_9ZZZZ
MKLVSVLLKGVVLFTVGITLGLGILILVGIPPFWLEIPPFQQRGELVAEHSEVCGILIIEDSWGPRPPLHTCVLYSDDPEGFRLYHPNVPGYEDNSMTFYAGVNEVPVVVPRGETQTY